MLTIISALNLTYQNFELNIRNDKLIALFNFI